MNEHAVATRFPAVTQTLARLPTRRDIVRGLAGAGLGLAGLRLSGLAGAKQKHARSKRKKKNRKRPQPVVNQYGCLEVGQPCKGDSTRCCSGVCEGKKPKKGKKDTRRCVAHGTGTCEQDQLTLCEVYNPAPAPCNNAACVCVRTTADSSFCGTTAVGVSDCAACQRDSDCQALGFAAGSACVPWSTGTCANI